MLAASFRQDNRITYEFLCLLAKINITTRTEAAYLIDKRADHQQMIVFMLESFK